MRRLLFAALFAFAALPVHAQQARVVAACGSLAPFGPDAVGGVAFPTMDTTGKLCLSGGGGGGSIVGGTTPVTGTCPAGQFLYNNSGVVGCSASSATIALPQAVTGGVSGGIPYFSATTTMAASVLLANNAIMLGGGAAASPKTTTTGTGVVTALGVNTNAAGGVALVSTVPTAGNFVKWAAGGLVDGGAGSGGGTITAGTTPTSGYTAGQMLYSDGSLAQASNVFYAPPLVSQRNSTTPQTLRVYNTYTAGTNEEWGGLDWTTTANVLTIGAQKSGTGLVRGVQFTAGGTAATNFMDYAVSNAGTITSNSSIVPNASGFWSLGTASLSWLSVATSNLQMTGTQPTITGCTAGTKLGGTIAGTFQLGAACAAAATIVWTGMPAQVNGYICDAQNRSLPAMTMTETATTTTGFTLTVAGTSGASTNVIQWKCVGY